jgi:hypothetical protein
VDESLILSNNIKQMLRRTNRHLHDACAACLIAVIAHGVAKLGVQIGMVSAQKLDDLDVFFSHGTKINAFKMDQAQKLRHGARHVSSGFVSRSTTLSYANFLPELFLIQAELLPNFSWIRDLLKKTHCLSRLPTSAAPEFIATMKGGAKP